MVRDGELVGLVTLGDARTVREVERDAYTVGDVMTTDLAWVSAADDVIAAVTRMGERDVGRVPVRDAKGAFVGLLTRSDLMTAFEILQHRETAEIPAIRTPPAETP